METKEIIEVVQELGPIIGLLAVIAGTLLGGWLQARLSRSQASQEHSNQLAVLTETHRQNIEVLTLQQKREEDLRVRQFAESDRADRLVVAEYVDLLLPRLIEASSIEYLGGDNRDADELRRYKQLQRFMGELTVDAAHPERNASLRMAFLLFQLMAAMRIALNARWTRPLTDLQTRFLAHWEDQIEPMMCSGRYPGKEFLYREQVEIITEEMLTGPEGVRITRPLNWAEFCRKYAANPVVKELSELVAGRFRYVFDETRALPPRRATQCRMAIMALYLIRLSQEAGNDSWTWREEPLWRTVTAWFNWEWQQRQGPKWFVFTYGDVASRLGVAPGSLPTEIERPNNALQQTGADAERASG